MGGTWEGGTWEGSRAPQQPSPPSPGTGHARGERRERVRGTVGLKPHDFCEGFASMKCRMQSSSKRSKLKLKSSKAQKLKAQTVRMVVRFTHFAPPVPVPDLWGTTEETEKREKQTRRREQAQGDVSWLLLFANESCGLVKSLWLLFLRTPHARGNNKIPLAAVAAAAAAAVADAAAVLVMHAPTPHKMHVVVFVAQPVPVTTTCILRSATA